MYDMVCADPDFLQRGAAPTVEGLGGQMTSVITFDDLVQGMTEDDLDILWRYGGYERTHGPRPHRRELTVLRMVGAATKYARRALARLFASLSPARLVAAVAPHCLIRVVAAFLRRTADGMARIPRSMAAHPPARRMLSQAGHGAVVPSRGSPVSALHMCHVMPGAPPM
ncbi:hypothetical protein [Streptomyces sp. NPDC101249]|uniref:hypothetical protein n=1 Tax=Streptomyces sp. NPDC101249 TaxID=3366140 RepID=UPI00382D7615